MSVKTPSFKVQLLIVVMGVASGIGLLLVIRNGYQPTARKFMIIIPLALVFVNCAGLSAWIRARNALHK